MQTYQLTPIDIQHSDPKIRELLLEVNSRFGRIPKLLEMMAHSPAMLAGFLGLYENLQLGQFTAPEREQIAILVAQESGCDYCLSAHVATAKSMHVPTDEIERNRWADSGDPKLQSILMIAREMVRHRGHVAPEHLARAHELGVTDAQLMDLVGHVSMNLMMAFANHLSKTEIDWPVVLTSAPD